MATFNPPLTHADSQSTIGYSYRIAAREMLLEMQDRFDAQALGIVPLEGDAAGTGSNKIRILNIGGMGWALPFAALASENSVVIPSPVDSGYSEVTIGQYGVGHSETYFHQGLAQQREIVVDGLKTQIGNSWAATFRRGVCLVGATITDATGAAGTTLSVDDYLDYLTAYELQLGAGAPALMLAPTQMNELKRSFRDEPAFQTAGATFSAIQGLSVANGMVGQFYQNFAGLGPSIGITDDIVDSGGAFQGFGFSPGGVGWARMTTGSLRTANPQGTMLVPELGLVVEDLSDGARETTRGYRATAWIGFAKGATNVFMQRRLISAS